MCDVDVVTAACCQIRLEHLSHAEFPSLVLVHREPLSTFIGSLEHWQLNSMALVPAANDAGADIDALLLQRHPYFIGKPIAFQQSADVLLVLDSSEEVPVHSAFLSAHSSVFCEILKATDQRTAQGLSAGWLSQTALKKQ